MINSRLVEEISHCLQDFLLHKILTALIEVLYRGANQSSLDKIVTLSMRKKRIKTTQMPVTTLLVANITVSILL